MTLFEYVNPTDADETAITSRQLAALKTGVREAIEGGEGRLGVPGALSWERWNHAGVGVSAWMHESGVVVLRSSDDTLVTDAQALQGLGETARGRFLAKPGPVRVATDEVPPSDESDGEEGSA